MTAPDALLRRPAPGPGTEPVRRSSVPGPRTPWTTRLLATVLPCLAACSGADPGEAARAEARAARATDPRPNVLLVVVDTLRRDHLGCYGHDRDTSPNLDRLAREGVRYDRAYSQAPWTTPSIGSLLSSRYPSELGIATDRSALPEGLDLLPEVLRRAGYLTGGVVSHSFCSARWGFARGFTHFDESQVLGHAAVTTTGVTERALAFLDEFGPGPDPWFLWVHYFDPHCAYIEQEVAFGGPGDYAGPVRSGQLYSELWKRRRELTEADHAELRRLYDSEVRHTDAGLGRLLERLDALELADDTVVVVTADHGEEFGDHGSIGHARTLFDELVHVPLVARFPGVAPAVVQDPVALVDVFPTVLAATGVPGPELLRGVDVRPGSAALDPERVVFSETERGRRLRAAIGARRKLVARGLAGSLELYDLEQDPDELAARRLPRRTDDPQAVPLAEALEAFAREVEAGRLEAREVELSGEDRTHLDQLGYGGDDGGDGDPGDGDADPSDGEPPR